DAGPPGPAAGRRGPGGRGGGRARRRCTGRHRRLAQGTCRRARPAGGLMGAEQAGRPGRVEIYDTTLRDGSQQVGLDLTVADKRAVAEALDALGVDVIEGGWPGSNPKDAEFFARAAELPWRNAQLAAFGATRPPRRRAGDDPNLAALLAARTPIV